MITSLLVANRGEIACRIFRTCRALGIATVAVFSDVDADALHVREADTAVRLPGAAPADTYLRGDLVVAAALAAGADAIHPGYGFLSENAGFARAVTGAGLTWVGPPADAIEAMASKTRAKKLMAAAGVPLLAPVEPAAATVADLPLLLKAAAGGGGRGMRVVRELGSLEAELTASVAEARSAFGDGEVFAEPYVERGRHVEVQIMADAHSTVWTLGTRDCSLQRRHQKVIEEAPAPGLPDALRATLSEAATAAARAVEYRGAGTVEFLVAESGDRAYFLEMNTRLQVEHPVTEAVFGLDLVALQLRTAQGEPLPPGGPPQPHGHAVEARLYAEDPAAGWAPQTGTLHRLDVPGTGALNGSAPTGTPGGAPTGTPAGTGAPTVRLDTGYTGGDTIGIHYDPMLAKVIAHAPTRTEALRTLAYALERARIHGPVTNRDLLVRSLRHPDVVAARLDTGFYDRQLPGLTTPAPEPLAALAAALADAAGARIGGWRNVPSQPQSKTYRSEPDGEVYEVRYRLTRDGLRADGFPGVRLHAATPRRVSLEADGVLRHFDVEVHGDRAHVGPHTLTLLPRFPDPAARTAPGSLLAPMPGTVVRVADGLAAGDTVTAGQPLIWLEAMKMEHRITAPAAGTLTALHAAPGRQVEVGALLAVVRTGQPDTQPDTQSDMQPDTQEALES
ncbi:acety-l/propionyl-CoA carboxylase subunit alpha [Streptomyces sp. SID10853]|uniref:acetyl/propionyl/methylcrotonyl-CoA carboxylase subunit alpha n=1 Tax=Streptomyces sp. SID10853 TaxID=2706028 RepID=UPI0013BF0D9A|nr:biotin carboxylase N-terminal domain-containing protein [Streptomyces sp. SID10853]NDZ80536.1 acety-l/propionyl-CoA carboxylase subunit alpha [Streptomyces sp. SID10853]